MGKPTVYLIDGSSYIFRAYHGIRSLSTRDGFPTNAIYGFTQMIFKFIRDYDPQYLGIVFDSKEKTFRHDLYPEYKANRPEPPEDLSLQFPIIFEMVEAMGIPVFRIPGYEADDIMGSLAIKLESEGDEVVLITGDKDFCQVVTPKITLFDTMRNIKTGETEVIEKFGVPPDGVIDLLALAGDSTDNIPGVKGIGPKTASELVKKWGSVEKIYEKLDELTPRQKKLMEESRADAQLSKKLVTIETDMDLNLTLDDLKYEGFDREKLSEEFKKYEFRSLLEEIKHTGGDKSGGGNDFESVINYDDYKAIFDEEGLDKVVQRVMDTGEMGFDLETTSQHAMLAEIVGVSISPAAGEAYYIPTGHISLEASSKGQLPLESVLNRLKGIVEDEGIKKFGQNLKYEVIVLKRYGLELTGIECDTMLAAHLIDSSKLSYSLDTLAFDYLGHNTIQYKDVTGTGKNKIGFAEVELDKAIPYACEDAEVSFLLAKALLKKLKELELLEGYSAFEVKFIDVLASIEMAGVKVDAERLTALGKELEGNLEEITESIYTEAGRKFNINSTLQLRAVLFDELGLPVNKRTKTGEPSTDVEVLNTLSPLHTVPELILKFRGLSKLKSTYIDALPKLINPKTGRIHTSFNQVGTSTGRLSSSDPNLQNIPVKTPEGRRIREAFITEEGFSLLSADYSQIELRLLAHFSGDKNLLDAFNNDMDIHSRTAQEIFGVEEGEVDPDMRRMAKTINFGIIYGISPFGLSKQLGIPVGTSKQYIDDYFARYGSVKEYMEGLVEEAKERGFATTLLGRRRPITELQSKNRAQRGFGERAAINTPIQGSAADIIKIAMIRIQERLLSGNFKTRMVLQVHDELLFEVAEDEIDVITKIVREEMEGAVKLKVPIKVDVGVSSNWSEAH